MKISKLIKTLQKAKKDFGDVDVQLMNEENGYWHPLAEVLKLHPYTMGIMDREKPVNGIAFTRFKGNSDDLILAKKD